MPDLSPEGVPDMSSFKVLFDGDRHDIDADVLLTSVGNIASLLSGINEEVDADKDIRIKIEAPERGSFDLDINLLTEVASLAMGQSDAVAYAEALVSIAVSVFDLHKFLGGEEPEALHVEGENVIVEDGDGNEMEVSQTVNNFYFGDASAEELLQEIFSALQEDENVDGLRLQDPETEEDRFEARREEFSRLAGEEADDERETRTNEVRDTVTIVRVVFDRDRKWQFIRDGNPISAPIDDLGFWARVESREDRFGQGDRLDVTITREQEFEPAVNDWVTKFRTITQVYEHIPADEQGNLFDDEGQE